MPTFRLFSIAASCVISLALFVMAGDKLMTFLNVDLIATLLRANPLSRPLETNEAAVMADARSLAVAGAVALGVAIVLGFFHALRRTEPLSETQSRLSRTLEEQELALVSHYRDLGVQLARSRDTLAADMGDMGTSTQHMRGALELRFASVESSLKHMDETLVSRLDGLAAQVSHTLQSSGSKWLADQTQASDRIEERLAHINGEMAQRLDGIDTRLQDTAEELSARYVELINQAGEPPPARLDASPGIDLAVHQEVQAVRSGLERLDRQLEQMAAQWHGDAQQIGSQLSSIDLQLMASVDLARAPDPSVTASHGALEQLGRRIENIEALLRSNGEQVGTQLTDLRMRMVQGQSVNNSTFGDFNTQPAQLGGTNGALQSMILNLAHLQVDLRAERSALRKRLRELPPRQA